MVLGEVLRFVDDRRLYQVLFLRDDDSRSVRVDEVSVVDFDVVRSHLERGESVFITQRRGAEFRLAKRRTRMRVRFANECNSKEFSRKSVGRPWFLAHT